jgi:hypothetical protein
MDPREREEIISAINERDRIVYETFKDYMDRSIKAFSEQLGQFEERNASQHHEIITHQKETNGRVTCLENDTRVFRWASRNPKTAIIVSVLILAGVIALGIFLGLDNLLKII